LNGATVGRRILRRLGELRSGPVSPGTTPALGRGNTVWGSVIAVRRTPAGQVVLYGNDGSGQMVGSDQAQADGPFSAWAVLG
jgi:hypothetical protein